MSEDECLMALEAALMAAKFKVKSDKIRLAIATLESVMDQEFMKTSGTFAAYLEKQHKAVVALGNNTQVFGV